MKPSTPFCTIDPAFGVVMKAVMAEVGSQADGKLVAALVRELMG